MLSPQSGPEPPRGGPWGWCTVAGSRPGGSLGASRVSVSLHTVLAQDFFFFGHTLQLVESYFPEQTLNLLPSAVRAQISNHWTTRETLSWEYALCSSHQTSNRADSTPTWTCFTLLTLSGLFFQLALSGCALPALSPKV